MQAVITDADLSSVDRLNALASVFTDRADLIDTPGRNVTCELVQEISGAIGLPLPSALIEHSDDSLQVRARKGSQTPDAIELL